MKYLLCVLGFLLWALSLEGQCKPAVDVVDEFDSVRTVAAKPINAGYMVPSNFQTVDGIAMIEEAKLLFLYSEKDSIRSFFLTVAVPEREYLSIESGFNVLLKLDDEQVVGLMNVPDQGLFDNKTNMRLYQHVCVIPMDLFFALTHLKIEKIRINYKTYKHTIELTPPQQEAIRKAIRCVGETVGLFSVKP